MQIRTEVYGVRSGSAEEGCVWDYVTHLTIDDCVLCVHQCFLQ